VALSIIRGRHAELTHEGAPQRVRAGEAALRGDLLWRQLVRLQQLLCGAHSSPFDPRRRGETVVSAFPRTPRFEEDIIQAFYDGVKHRPDTTFGNVKADVIADKNPHFHRGNFCNVIRNSA